jgi:carbamoyltransferase
MLLVAPVKEKRRYSMPDKLDDLTLYERLYYPRSDVPSVTHIDYSARVHSVNKETNPRFWTLLNSFQELTGFGILINTSFNVRGEPIVCTPEDAYRCFMGTEMDYLVMGNCLFKKTDQPRHMERDHWKSDYEPD